RQALISLQGPRSGTFVESLTGQPVTSESDGRINERSIANQPVLIAGHSRCGEAGFDLFVAAEAAPQLWQIVIERGKEFGARAVRRPLKSPASKLASRAKAWTSMKHTSCPKRASTTPSATPGAATSVRR